MIMSNINRNTMQVIIPLEKIFSWFSEFKNREFGGRLDIEWGNKHKARNHQAFEKLASWTTWFERLYLDFAGEKRTKTSLINTESYIIPSCASHKKEALPKLNGRVMDRFIPNIGLFLFFLTFSQLEKSKMAILILIKNGFHRQSRLACEQDTTSSLLGVDGTRSFAENGDRNVCNELAALLGPQNGQATPMKLLRTGPALMRRASATRLGTGAWKASWTWSRRGS